MIVKVFRDKMVVIYGVSQVLVLYDYHLSVSFMVVSFALFLLLVAPN